MRQPYSDQPKRAFWRRAIGGQDITRITELFDGVPGLAGAKIATAGSCFAQHIGRALRARGLHYMDYEPPPFFLSPQADNFGYGIYSCRYGNIYTVRQLRQLFDEAFGNRRPEDAVWAKSGRYFDALRPGIEPNGFGSPEEVAALRSSHLVRVRSLFTDLDIFVFTLGLTEAWMSNKDDTVYPTAPGVIAGDYEPADYRFVNFRYNDVYGDLRGFIHALRAVNANARIILTVSPVPLAATATGNHVLVATTYSKSVLRSVAGDISVDFPGVYYFPSFEVITGQPTRHIYYNNDLRTVGETGVAEVMRHFFSAAPTETIPVPPPEPQNTHPMIENVSLIGFEHCEESLIDSRIA